MPELSADDRIDLEAGGLIRVDKPVGWTSFDVVNKVRYALKALAGKRVKVGHAGTLDPLASGLLLLGYGPGTKRLEELTGLDKTYAGTVRLGAVTPSYDAETEEQDAKPWEHLSADDIGAAVDSFQGTQQQRPPLFSAKRVDGTRGYHLAREGAEVELPPATVTVHEIAVLAVRGREVDIRVRCSKGTYIRSLAHDIGQRLGCGGYLSGLRRTAIGPWEVDGAPGPEDWSEHLRGLAESQ